MPVSPHKITGADFHYPHSTIKDFNNAILVLVIKLRVVINLSHFYLVLNRFCTMAPVVLEKRGL